MMSVAAASSGVGGYYINLVAEDYYLKGGEPEGKWIGKGADDLKLDGGVERQPFSLLLHGYSPDGKALIKNAGFDNHQAGWDITFSAPKSVSVLWSQADGEMRQAIQNAQQQAATKAMEYLEEEVATTRRGEGGTEKEPARLICATFEHGTARQTKEAETPDPNLHTHCFVMNVCTRQDGTTGTIESKPFYLHQHVADALYKAELAAELQFLGFAVERAKHGFEVAGVPATLRDEFSKRREAIVATLEQKGMQGAKAAEIANLATRETKEHTARAVLFPLWHTVGRSHAFSGPQVETLRQPEPIQTLTIHEALKEALPEALKTLTTSQSHFTEPQFLRYLAQEGQMRGLDSDTLRAASKEILEYSIDIARLGEKNGIARFTTTDMLATEARMLQAVEQSRANHAHTVQSKTVSGAQARTETTQGFLMNAEQAAALLHITRGKGSIAVLAGMAGTGKTTLLQAAREAWEAEGYTVFGAALAGKAAKGLEQGAGIESRTIAKTLHDLTSYTGRGVKPRLEITAQTILVVDEAGMVDTKNMAALIEHVTAKGGKLVLVGDAKQLQPIEAGGPFRHIADKLGYAELTHIVRQRHSWERHAVKDFAAGKARAGLEAYKAEGLLTVSQNRSRAMTALIRDWVVSGIQKPEGALIFTGTNAEARKLNEMAQAERQKAGVLSEASLRVDGQTFHAQDRLLFTKRNAQLGVHNGDMGTIVSLDVARGVLRVQVDGGQFVSVPVADYKNLALGYAVTTHKGQGVTVNRAFVLLGGKMSDLHLSYVQASRALEETRLYTERRYGKDTMKELADEMSRERQKELAHDVLKPQELQLSQER